MQNKFLTEALGWGFIITLLFMASTCSYDLGKKKGRKQVYLDEVSCIKHFTQVHCVELEGLQSDH